MKASEVLQHYTEGRRDFRGENLRGQNFRGQNLSGADFSECDIRGTNFKNAILKGTKFCKAKAGLQKRWVVGLLMVALLLIVLSSFSSKLIGSGVAILVHSSVREDRVGGWVSLAVSIIFVVFSYRQGLGRGLVAVAVALVGFGVVALFTEVLNTVDLIFRNGIDWKAFMTAFKKLQVENEDTELTIQSMENKKEKIHSEFNQNYELALKALEERYKAQLEAKDNQITIYCQQSADLKEIIKLQASQPIQIQNINQPQASDMSNIYQNHSGSDDNIARNKSITYNDIMQCSPYIKSALL